MNRRPILTVALNPAADKTLVLETVTPGAVHRVHESHLDPAGKGVNAARMIRRLGWPVLALGFLAGDIGHLVQRALTAEAVPTAFTWTAGQTRINVNLFATRARQGTSFYEDGPFVSVNALVELRAAVSSRLPGAAALILAGSLPPGAPPETYADIIVEARQAGVPAILDAVGEPFRLGLQEGPWLVKPNRDEAADILGRALPDCLAVTEAATELVDHGAGVAVISLGNEGAVAADRDGAWLATPPPVALRSTVGSGDSMLAGLAVARARGEPLVAGVRLGTAAGAATAMVAGTALGTAEDIAGLLQGVQLRRLA